MKAWLKMKLIQSLVIILIFFFSFTAKAYSDSQPAGLKVDDSLGITQLSLLMKADNALVNPKERAAKFLEYFFTSLVEPENKFWVNLKSNEPDRIADYELGNTDIGRIMLAADLQLKKDIGILTNPKTSQIGKEFWQRLYQKAEELMPGCRIKIPSRTRLWIISDKAVIFEEDNKAYIVEASLRVLQESKYLSGKTEIQDEIQKEFQDYASGLMQELVLPVLNQRVNSDPIYQPLRQVYLSLILSKWYKEKFSLTPNYLMRLGRSNILQDISLDFKSTPQDTFKEYLSSLKTGEYDFKEQSGYTIRRYFSGGIDFKNIKLTRTTQRPNWLNTKLLTCEFILPQGIGRPLQYAKSQLELAEGNSLEDDFDSSVVLAKNLPEISPLSFPEQQMQNFDSARTNKLVLSKL